MSDERKPMANITPFGLRMQPDLKARIEAAAKKNERSMNAEIVARLEASFEGRIVDLDDPRWTEFQETVSKIEEFQRIADPIVQKSEEIIAKFKDNLAHLEAHERQYQEFIKWAESQPKKPKE